LGFYGKNQQQTNKHTQTNKQTHKQIKLANDVASAMDHYMSFGFIHRDLKSDNMLIQADFAVKIW